MDSVMSISKIIDGKVQGVINEVGRKIHDKIENTENIVMNMVENKITEGTRAMTQNIDRKMESLHIEIDSHFDGQI